MALTYLAGSVGQALGAVDCALLDSSQQAADENFAPGDVRVVHSGAVQRQRGIERRRRRPEQPVPQRQRCDSHALLNHLRRG